MKPVQRLAAGSALVARGDTPDDIAPPGGLPGRGLDLGSSNGSCDFRDRAYDMGARTEPGLSPRRPRSGR